MTDWFFRFIPVPVVGSAALHKRMQLQEQECNRQQSRLEVRHTYMYKQTDIRLWRWTDMVATDVTSVPI